MQNYYCGKIQEIIISICQVEKIAKERQVWYNKKEFNMFLFIMEKQQKQNPQNTPSDTKLAISPEQEKQLQKEKQQVLLLSKIQRGTLSNESLSTYLQKYHEVDISKYSPEIKQKFLEEISMLFEEFKDFDESMITKLKSIREGMSF